MTDENGLQTEHRDQVLNVLDQIDSEQFLVRNAHSTGFNLLDDDAQQGLLTLGLPESAFQGANHFDQCLFWFPRFCPTGKSVHLASSRLGNRLDQKRFIFDALRTFAVQNMLEDNFLIIHEGTSLHEYTCRLSELFRLRTLTFRPFPAAIDSDWFRERLNSNAQNIAYYMALDRRVPEPDELLICGATEVRILSVRPKGKVAEFTFRRLNSTDPAKVLTYLLVDANLTASSLIRSLHSSGTIDWWLYKPEPADSLPPPIGGKIHSLIQFGRQVDVTRFQIHWTRQRNGPWPGQSRTRFVDDLILGLKSNDHSRIASLCRIVSTGKLLADNRLSRDSSPVVSFADVAVNEVIDRRVYRSHLGRWDFEPCGIAIAKSVLQSMGARPVIYGDAETWTHLSETDRPFFQIARSTSARGNTIDWTQENEYRVCGNVSLDKIAVDNAFLFVETLDEATKVAPLSRWPVVVLQNG